MSLLLKALKNSQNRIEKGDYPLAGLCTLLYLITDCELYDLDRANKTGLRLDYACELKLWLKECFKSWEHYSGDDMFPISCPEEDKARLAMKFPHQEEILSLAYTHLPKYTGAYGELRKDLLQHLINCAEEELK